MPAKKKKAKTGKPNAAASKKKTVKASAKTHKNRVEIKSAILSAFENRTQPYRPMPSLPGKSSLEQLRERIDRLCKKPVVSVAELDQMFLTPTEQERMKSMKISEMEADVSESMTKKTLETIEQDKKDKEAFDPPLPSLPADFKLSIKIPPQVIPQQSLPSDAGKTVSRQELSPPPSLPSSAMPLQEADIATSANRLGSKRNDDLKKLLDELKDVSF